MEHEGYFLISVYCKLKMLGGGGGGQGAGIDTTSAPQFSKYTGMHPLLNVCVCVEALAPWVTCTCSRLSLSLFRTSSASSLALSRSWRSFFQRLSCSASTSRSSSVRFCEGVRVRVG